MKYLFVIIITFIGGNVIAQQVCNCEKEFLFVKDYIETNYAGFSDKVNSSNKQAYASFTDDLLKKAKASPSSNYCYFTIQTWLNYFKDGHIQLIRKPNSNSNDSAESISLTTNVIEELKSKSLNDIEGIYSTDTKNYEIAIVKSANNYRDYAGVIINTSVKSWKSGQVKIELKHLEGDNYQGIYYFKDHHPEVKTYTIKEGKFSPPDFMKTITPIVQETTEPFNKIENSNKVVFYKDIDDSTAYLRIKSFDDHFAKKIAYEIKSHEKQLKSKPYLVIDVRYNGGGSDFSYSPLLPFIYTNPIKTIGVDVFSTPDNIISWQKVIDENPGLPVEVKKQISDIISQMKAGPFKLINVAGDQTDSLPMVYSNPRKVAILIDGECGSTTEQFLLAAKQSKKVILMGQHTAGVLDYSNMRMVNFDCLPYILGYATSRSRRIPDNSIDNKGITPDVILDFNKPWLESIFKRLKK